MRPLSQIEIREVDQIAIEQYGVPGVVLMENAGRGCSQLISPHWEAGRVVICCGKGNNGGDGFVIARYLENAGWSVQVRLAFPPDSFQGDAAVFLASIQKSGLDVRTIQAEVEAPSSGRPEVSWARFQSELNSADLVVDALLGTGLTGSVRSPYKQIIESINASGRPVFAVDLPSGMDCNTGKPLGACIRATRTATMVAEKLGFENPESESLTGLVDVVEIGLPRALVRLLELKAPEAMRS
jgi:NAD(P)H-hydrate epimerase